MQKIKETMTIKELKKVLSDYPDDFEIYLSSDSEGNHFGTLHDQNIYHSQKDRVLILAPWEEGLTDEEVMPIANEEFETEMREFDEYLSQGRVGNVIKSVKK